MCKNSGGNVVIDALCSGSTKPSDSRECSTEICPPDSIAVVEPDSASILEPEKSYNITWSGGILYSKVFFKIRKLDSVGVWLDLSDRLGTVDTNDETITWTIPNSLTSGEYEMFVESKNADFTTNATSEVFSVRTEKQFAVHIQFDTAQQLVKK